MNREPLLRISRNDNRPFWQSAIIRTACIMAALIISALFVYSITHLNPLNVYVSMFKGAFGTVRRTWVTLRDSALLLMIALGLAPAFKMHFWNTGAEGQVLIGGLTTAALMIYGGNSIPTVVLLLIMAIVSMLAGALWGFLPAYFKSRYNTNETLFTLMMNYVAIQIVEFFVDFWDKKESHSVGVINGVTNGGWFPPIAGQQYLLNILLVTAVTLFVFFYLRNSKHGYEIAVTGESENTARYAGINVPWVVIRTMLLSGAICGLAGFMEVAGISHTISRQTAGGRGFTAIIVSWLAKLNPFVMAVFSLFIVFLNKGATQIASEFNLNEYASSIITGILLFFILSSEFFINYDIHVRGRREQR